MRVACQSERRALSLLRYADEHKTFYLCRVEGDGDRFLQRSSDGEDNPLLQNCDALNLHSRAEK